MGLPTKKITIFGTEEITLTGLNCDQVEELMRMGQPDAQNKIDEDSAKKRAEFTVDTGTGEKFSDRKKTVLYKEFYDAFNAIHEQMMELSGLQTTTPGESLAVVEKSTSQNSAAA